MGDLSLSSTFTTTTTTTWWHSIRTAFGHRPFPAQPRWVTEAAANATRAAAPWGQLWQPDTAPRAVRAGRVRTVEDLDHSSRYDNKDDRTSDLDGSTNDDNNDDTNNDDNSLRLCVRNHLSIPLVWCWMDAQGRPHHFRKLYPMAHADTDTDTVTRDDHVEQTYTGHAFVLATEPSPAHSSDTIPSLDPSTILGAYRPHRRRDHTVHILEVKYVPTTMSATTTTSSRGWNCCRPGARSHVRHGSHRIHAFVPTDIDNDDDDNNQDDDNPLDVPRSVQLHLHIGRLDPTPLDTVRTNKYVQSTLAGWPVRFQSNWDGGDPTLRARLEQDLTHAVHCLPPHAVRTLRRTTPLWINRDFRYGPAASPVRARGLCFHPYADWLAHNQCHPAKQHGVELYDADEYRKDAALWGTGGVLLHEFCHAYHCLCVPQGYDNAEIQECYRLALEEGLYESVPVHGPQGPHARAYACTNAMEYWAELSTAFLGGVDTDTEYNKWFPFHRKQLRQHDPRAYQLLQRLWKVPCDNDNDNDTDDDRIDNESKTGDVLSSGIPTY
jgi:hypothetical protein